MTSSYDNFVSALEMRFDFHSARVVAKDAVHAAGLDDRSDWSEDELRLAAARIPPSGKDLGPVLEKLGLAASADAAPAQLE